MDGLARVAVGYVGGKDGEVERFGCGGGFGGGGLEGLGGKEGEEEKGGRGRWEEEKVIMGGGPCSRIDFGVSLRYDTCRAIICRKVRTSDTECWVFIF